MTSTLPYLPTHRPLPMHDDRVREIGATGIIGHVRQVRHSAAGRELEVYEDGALTGRWILATNVSILARAPELPTDCTFEGWSQSELDGFARSRAARIAASGSR